MSGHTSRVGQRVDQLTATDAPHEDYEMYDPWTGDYIAERDAEGNITSALPVLTSTLIGNVVEKSVETTTVVCPACEIAAKYDERADPICPNCGIMCVGKDSNPQPRLLRDAKAAGRINGDDTTRQT